MNSANNKPTQGAARSSNLQHGTKTQANVSRQGAAISQTGANTTGAKFSQTYSKTSGNINFKQQPSTTSLSNIIAPTSLANLAQLSGITLLPIGNINSDVNHHKQHHTLSCNLPSNISIHHHQAAPSGFTFSTTTNTPQRPQQPQLEPSGYISQTALSNNSAAAATGSSHHQQSIYNLATIPSIQSLNQATSTPADSKFKWNNSNETGDQTSHCKTQAKSRTSTKTNSRINNNSNSRKTKQQSNFNLRSNEVQVIPVSEGLPIFAGVSDMQPSPSGASYDDILSKSSLVDQDDHCVDVNGDMNNISLMKLMAILNNPALTITAVGSSGPARSPYGYPTSDDHQHPASSRSPLDSQQQISITLPGSPGRSSYQSRNEQLQSATISEQLLQSDLMTKSRFPQSAANLHMVHSDGIANCLSPTTKGRNANFNLATNSRNTNSINATKEISNLQPNTSHKQQPDIQLNWLTNSSVKNSNTSGYNPTPWSNDPQGLSLRNNSNSNSHDKISDPTVLSTSVRNLMMQQIPSGTKQPTVSVQLLKHIADQTKDNNWTSNQPQKTTGLEPECIVTVSRSVQQLNHEAKMIESLKTVSTDVQKRAPKQPLQTSQNRLYIPRPEDVTRFQPNRLVSGPKFDLINIRVDGCEEREVHVSERHSMLETMMSNDDENSAKRKSSMAEPDEIFINRSKRVMSKIDTMIERKKRRRFERISGRADPKTNSLEEQCAESEEEWSCDENMDVEYSGFIKTQLPLEEIETDEKRNHLLSVGLVSRDQRNKLSIEQCEEKIKIFSPLALEGTCEVPQAIQRFVDIMLKTGGDDIQLRTDSCIKRNDLPLIEGLNRNTSRLKMNYMNVLGLEKRSKRTTLYKVKPTENLNVPSPKLMDLNRVKSITSEKPKLEPDVLKQSPIDHSISMNTAIPTKLAFTSCREAMKPPSKNEYMKSLGLMAS